VPMLAFMDESGDCGLEFAKNSSPFFTYALAQFGDHEQAAACRAAIQLLRKDVLHVKDTFEFHFTECTHSQRLAFYNAVLPFDFRFSARTIEKANLRGKKGWDKKKFFFQRALDLMLEGVIRPYLVGAKLLIDGSTDRKFNKEVEVYLRRHAGFTEDGKKRLEEAHCLDSRKHDLIQLADMVCGAVARVYRPEKREPAGYLELIEGKQLNVELWSPKSK
jgi:hypothetical protein